MDDTNGYERIGRLLYGMQRLCGGLEGLAGLRHDARVAPATLEKSRLLAERYRVLEARCFADVDAVGDEEVSAFLTNARELDGEATAQCGPGWQYRIDPASP